jgi:hypothetical protein
MVSRHTWDRIAERGVLFKPAYATTPLCVPSRYTSELAEMAPLIDQKLGELELTTEQRLTLRAGLLKTCPEASELVAIVISKDPPQQGCDPV